jgi:mannose-6-phosphate isomerase-like protein (cupin superfamily)
MAPTGVVASSGPVSEHLSRNLRGLEPFAFEPRKVDKPWGYELVWALSEEYAGKILFVKAGESISLQFHNRKDESWYVQEGRAELEVGAVGDAMRDTEIVAAGRCFRFRPGTVHRLKAIEDTYVLEVSTPELDDVVRLEDTYGREGTTDP